MVKKGPVYDLWTLALACLKGIENNFRENWGRFHESFEYFTMQDVITLKYMEKGLRDLILFLVNTNITK